MFPDGVDGGAGLVGNDSVAQDTTPVGSEQAPTGDNPAWGELLGVLPSSLHQTVKPYLEKWDKGVEQRFTQVQSKYSPYNDFLSVDPQQIQASMELARLVASDPRAFYDRMTNHYGSEWGLTGQGQQNNTDNADDYSLDDLDEEDDLDPRLAKLQEQQDTIANFLAAQVEQQEQAKYQAEVQQQHAQIDNEFAAVAKANGVEELPKQAMKMILSLCTANEGLSITDAAAEVMPLFSAATAKTTPRIMSPGGGVPATNLDPAKMSPADTRSLVVQLLAQAKANG